MAAMLPSALPARLFASADTEPIEDNDEEDNKDIGSGVLVLRRLAVAAGSNELARCSMILLLFKLPLVRWSLT